MTASRRFVCPIGLVAALAAAPALAQDELPGPLADWRDWVLYGEEYRACPALNGTQAGERGNHVCAWPGMLSLSVDDAGAELSQTWTLYAGDFVPLPGGGEHWPQDVVVDGSPAPVVVRAGRPALRLPAGTHRVAGALRWTTRPASLPIPTEVGLVALEIDGAAVAAPPLERGTLWLGLRPDDAIEEDRLDVAVYRRLDDTLPQRLTTAVQIDVAGQSREIALVGAALEGFAGIALASELPARLDPDGTLRVQVRPGRWRVTLTSRAPALVDTIALPAAMDPWPAEEIWTFAPQPRLRVAALEGADAIDADQSGVPPEWRGLPSYRVAAGQSVDIVERSRNDAMEPNRLSLQRDLWLDFDGGAFTARDYVRGEMRSEWRLDMAAPYTMTMAAIDDENLLITTGLEPGQQGVELRAAALDLETTARIGRDGALPVTGFTERFDSVTTTLHVPPGYRVVAAPGADQASGVWIERWRLLDIFLVAIVVAAAWRLFGAVPGVLALAALAAIYHEPWAPHWAWLNLLVAIALVRVAPEGRLRTFCARYKYVSIAALALLLVPFTVVQLRNAIFPQLERPYLERGVADYPAAPPMPSMERRALDDFAAGASSSEALSMPDPDEITVTGSRIGGDVSRYLPGALVQTGPGLPDWAWTRHRLSFGGPVEAGETFRLVMIGPSLVTLWRLTSVALAFALAVALMGGRLPRLPTRTQGASAGAGGAIAVALAVAATLAVPSRADAQPAAELPSPALLEELKRRLTMPAPCHPSCADLTSADVELTAADLTIDLDFAAQDAVAVPVPANPRIWRPQTITIDGEAAGFLHRGPDERSWLRIEPGVHRVTLRGPLPAADSVSLPFPLPPRRITVTAPGWDVAGVNDGRLSSGTLELVRQRGDADGDGEDDGDALAPTVFAPFVRVIRRVEFDVDWTVTTMVERVAPADGAFTLPIDLLPGEAVVTPGIDVTGGRATAAFAADAAVVRWESRLPAGETLTLTAPAASPWHEIWTFDVGHIWHADYAGMPSTAPERFDPSFYTPEFYPRPGETLTLMLTRPAPAGGDTIAIDEVEYERNVGARSSDSTLALTYRSTRATEHAIVLPESSELDTVTIDGDPLPLRLDGARLVLPITPGEHDVDIRWRNADGASLQTSMPQVDLGGGASNLYLGLNLPADRWVLLASGPRLGPAVLYWPELLAFALAAFVLGRLPLSPLRTHEWLLLGFGLSTFAWPVIALFAVWAFAMSWRGRAESALASQPALAGEPALPSQRFNAMQVGLALLTLAAIGALVMSIPIGLLGSPDMQIASPVEFGAFAWFADRTDGLTPPAGAVSLSLWWYKAAMLAWALWLSFALLRWLPWAWRAYSRGGYWRPPPPRAPRPPRAPPATANASRA